MESQPPLNSSFAHWLSTFYPRLTGKAQQRLLRFGLLLALLSPAGANLAAQPTFHKVSLTIPQNDNNQFQINHYTANDQLRPAVAMSDDGNFVVVWESNGSDGDDTANSSIQGQRYNRLGQPQGQQFQVNTYTTNDQLRPDVAMSNNGQFVVIWESYGSSNGDTSGTTIQGQRYNTLGLPQGSQFQVNTYTTSSQAHPSVALDSDGDFVVVWQSLGSYGSDTSSTAIQGQRYNSLGLAQGSQFQVNTYTTNSQRDPTVSLDSDGDFVVVWHSYGSDGDDTSYYSIQGQRYNSIATPQGEQFQINSYTTNNQRNPVVSLDSDGDFVVVWRSLGSGRDDTSNYSIQGQRYNTLGFAQGHEFQVNTYTISSQSNPDVALDNDGNFVVVWHSFGSGNSDGNGWSVQGRAFNRHGLALWSEFQANDDTANNQREPAVALDNDGNFVVVWDSNDSVSNSDYDIQASQFNLDQNERQVNTYTTNSQRNPAVSLDSDGDFVVVWQSNGSSGDDLSRSTIQGQRYNSLGTTQGSQFQINTYTTDQQRNPAVSSDSDGDFVVVWESYGSGGSDLSDFSIQGQRYNSVGLAQGSQFQVNTYTTNSQTRPSVSLDSNGDFVVVWHSYGSSGGDTSLASIQGQRFNSLGVAQGTQFQVNTYTSNSQLRPAVSLDSDGDFVIVWDSFGSNGNDTSLDSIQGQRYNSLGLAQGSQFQINTYTTAVQRFPAVSLDSDGNFVVVWQSYGSKGSDTSGFSIQGQRYNSLSLAQGSQFQVNTYTNNYQLFPAVSLDNDGDFVVIWNSLGSNDGDTFYSIQGQDYNRVGTAQGSQFQVNIYTTSIQRHAAIASDSDGDFVVVWQSYGNNGFLDMPPDTSGYSIQAGRFHPPTSSEPTFISLFNSLRATLIGAWFWLRSKHDHSANIT